jgi:hypothetical protein
MSVPLQEIFLEKNGDMIIFIIGTLLRVIVIIIIHYDCLIFQAHFLETTTRMALELL